MNHDTFQAAHATDLARLLEGADPESTLAIQLRERLQDVRRNVGEEAQSTRAQPLRGAFFLRGDAVEGIEGIDSRLAGEALKQFARMFEQQAVLDERTVARAEAGRQRRPKGSSQPKLLLTDTPRGSFGFEFMPQSRDADLLELHGQTIVRVTEMIIGVAESQNGTSEVLQDDIPAELLAALKAFFKSLAQHKVGLRLATSTGVERQFDIRQVHEAAVRLDRSVTERFEVIRGVFRGVTLNTGDFNLTSEDDEQIAGTADDDLGEDTLKRFNQLLDQQCDAEVLRRTVHRLGGSGESTFKLLEVLPVEDDPD